MLIEKVLKIENEAKNERIKLEENAKILIAGQEDKAKEWANGEYLKWQKELDQIKEKNEEELLVLKKEAQVRQEKMIKDATSVKTTTINKIVNELLERVVK